MVLVAVVGAGPGLYLDLATLSFQTPTCESDCAKAGAASTADNPRHTRAGTHERWTSLIQLLLLFRDSWAHYTGFAALQTGDDPAILNSSPARPPYDNWSIRCVCAELDGSSRAARCCRRRRPPRRRCRQAGRRGLSLAWPTRRGAPRRSKPRRRSSSAINTSRGA